MKAVGITVRSFAMLAFELVALDEKCVVPSLIQGIKCRKKT
jgi:hypothetical protein